MEEKKTETKIDKRKQTSKANMAKARAEKKRQLKEKKETLEYEIDEDDSSSSEEDSSDDDVLVIKGKRGKKKEKVKKGKAIDPLQKEIDDLKALVAKLAKDKKSKGKPKTVVQIVNPSPQQQSTNISELDAIKKRLIFNMN